MRFAPAVLLALSLPVAAAATSAPTPAEAECAVWAREMSFAQSVAGHDAAAFAEHVGERAVFGTSAPDPARGRAAIVRQWAGIVDGKRVRLEWYPLRTTVNGAGDLAWSTGPALTEVLDPGAPQRYHLGHFRSVWRKEADGSWRVVFDDGDPPRPASEQEAQAFRAARPRACPHG
jgi:ketosteroid isomerase-like protein